MTIEAKVLPGSQIQNEYPNASGVAFNAYVFASNKKEAKGYLISYLNNNKYKLIEIVNGIHRFADVYWTRKKKKREAEMLANEALNSGEVIPDVFYFWEDKYE